MAGRILLFTMNPGELAELAGFARSLGLEAAAVVAGEASEAPEPVARLYTVAAETPEQLAAATLKAMEAEEPILLVTLAGKDNNTAAAILAAEKKLVMLTEALEPRIEGNTLRAKRRVLGGRAEASYTSPLPAVISLARGQAVPVQETRPLQPQRLEAPPAKVTPLNREPKKREAVDIESAEIVVGVGRGFRRKEDLAMAEELARLLGGVVGASRPIVADYGWLSEDRWIGISGKKIRPRLYLAIGISGAPQHMAAAMDAKLIIAVNKDKNAPIRQYADYMVVADLYQLLPVLIEKLKERLQG